MKHEKQKTTFENENKHMTKNEKREKKKRRKNTKTEEWKIENEKRYTKIEKQKKFKNATSV